MFDSLKSPSKKLAPVEPAGDLHSTVVEPANPVSEEQIKARAAFLFNQAQGIYNGTRMLRNQIMMALEAKELSAEMKTWLFGEFLAVAKLVEGGEEGR